MIYIQGQYHVKEIYPSINICKNIAGPLTHNFPDVFLELVDPHRQKIQHTSEFSKQGQAPPQPPPNTLLRTIRLDHKLITKA